jgi:hypothetical protein
MNRLRSDLVSIDADVPCCHVNDAFEMLHKAMRENPSGGDASLHQPHPNPALRAHVEDVFGRLSRGLAAIRDGFAAVLSGHPLPVAKAARWPDDELRAARLALAGRRPVEYSTADWMLLVDVLIHDNLPPEVIDDDAQLLAVRAELLGRVQAALPSQDPVTLDLLRDVHLLLPTRFGTIPPRLLNPVERAMLEIGQARAALAITDIVDSARASMKRVVLEHSQAMLLGQAAGSPRVLQTRLFDKFADQNRDMRRVAVTEIGEIAGQGFIATLAPGTKVRRSEDYADACDWCASISGRVLTVVAADAPNKDWDTTVWVGKTNVGRSSSPAKRVGGTLVARTADELWSIAAGTQHPNCRGRWTVVPGQDKPAEVSQEFADWLTDLLDPKTPNPPASGVA